MFTIISLLPCICSFAFSALLFLKSGVYQLVFLINSFFIDSSLITLPLQYHSITLVLHCNWETRELGWGLSSIPDHDGIYLHSSSLLDYLYAVEIFDTQSSMSSPAIYKDYWVIKEWTRVLAVIDFILFILCRSSQDTWPALALSIEKPRNIQTE